MEKHSLGAWYLHKYYPGCLVTRESSGRSFPSLHQTVGNSTTFCGHFLDPKRELDLHNVEISMSTGPIGTWQHEKFAMVSLVNPVCTIMVCCCRIQFSDSKYAEIWMAWRILLMHEDMSIIMCILCVYVYTIYIYMYYIYIFICLIKYTHVSN